MSIEAETPTPPPVWQRRPLVWFAGAAAGLLLLAAVLLGVLRGCDPTAAGLLPPLATATPVPQLIPGEPAVVSFAELNADPFQYINRRIRVTGDLTFPEQPNCTPYSGPRFVWALVAEQLQLDARNFERVMRQVAPATTLTVEGTWRQYQGPLGCGKGAPRGVAWYLEVQRIIQPNPLYSIDGVVISIENGVPSLPDGSGFTPTITPDQPIITPGATITPTAVITSTVDPFATPSITPSPTLALPGEGTPTLFPTATATPPAGGTLPSTVTPPAGATPTATFIPGTTPTLTPELPPVATATPGTPGSGYPGPPTATPTATTNPYP